MPEPHEELDNRLTSVESDVANLREGFDELKSTVQTTSERIVTKMDALTAAYSDVKMLHAASQADSRAASGKISTGTLLTGVGLLFGGCSFVLSLSIVLGAMSLNPIRETQTRQAEELHDHISSHGHSGAMSDIAAMREKFAEVETQFRAEKSMRERLAVELDATDAQLEQARVRDTRHTERLARLEGAEQQKKDERIELFMQNVATFLKEKHP